MKTDPRIIIRKLSRHLTDEQKADALRYVESLINPYIWETLHSNARNSLVKLLARVHLQGHKSLY